MKAISASENLAVSEKAWLILREEGAIVEEPVEDDDEEGGGGHDEKGAVEKVGLGLQLNEKLGLQGYDTGTKGGQEVDF